MVSGVSLYDELGVRPIINGRSFSTKVGGSIMDDEVIQAMSEAARSFVRIEELQEAAGEVIAEITGAEAGYVTSGASAALTLGMAACIARLDPVKMNRLPDSSGMRNEVIIQRSHRNDYDHALRAAGAVVYEVGFPHAIFPYEVEEAISEKTAALFWLAGAAGHSLSLSSMVEIAHRHGLPVIVDAAAELPPRENLQRFVAEGADLVAFSGGKHIRGPQASGFLCGKKELILSSALQHQDMDVFPETWSRRNMLADRKMLGPPHHGIGRGMKVGKEEIVGLVTALRRYTERDLDRELETWKQHVRVIVAGIEGIRGLRGEEKFPLSNGRPVPFVAIEVDSKHLGLDAFGLVNCLQDGNPCIVVYENQAHLGQVIIFPEALRSGEAEIIVKRLVEISSAAKS